MSHEAVSISMACVDEWPGVEASEISRSAVRLRHVAYANEPLR
jgi:hypothetical protein